MKQTSFILLFFLTTLFCFGQKDHLEPIKDNNHIDVKKYYDKVHSLLSVGFSKSPYASYICRPSFDEEYAFSIERFDNKTIIISNRFSENYWYAGMRDSVKIISKKTEISNDMFLKIGELFELFTAQTKEREREFKTLPDGTIAEIYIERSDGNIYAFTSTDKDGKIKTGETWSPHQSDQPMLNRLVKICDKLCSVEIENISQTNITQEIDELTSDYKKSSKLTNPNQSTVK